ncbi:bifunctional AP-4-A phosphorylase/ADP sulfurylase [Cryomyces antarcticus]|uniref:Bifunctional AP-4-A phosphorylase/ADP sulfurylase n=1 Tax=Cryomyces antarcticus TaxID=329879 RepID=A0ABR0LJK3_9PEZI|nr:bifunctional AP-4-A phosphorylase/ADP sulfurylase [Cryomyces antarcticus]
MAKQNHNWEPLIDEVLKSGVPAKSGSKELRALPKLPFTHFAAPVPVSPIPSHLFKLYTDLYEAAASAVRSYIRSHPGDLELHSGEGGAAPISYNLAFTTAGMIICPRKKEGGLLRRDDGTEVGSVALNGTILAGTLMVKDEGEWELLKNDNGKLNELLRAVGLPQEYTTIDSIKL